MSPEVSDAPEEGDEIKWQEKPELIAEVKNKIAAILENSAGRQVVETQDAIRFLRRNLGSELAAFICSIEDKDFTAFGRSQRPRKPSPLQARNIAAAYVILDILLSVMPIKKTKEWLIDYNDYLYGIPAIEMGRRPEDVRMAALHEISEGNR